MTTKHTLTFYFTFGLRETGVNVTYKYTPGRPARGPSYACGGEPPEPPEVTFVSAKLPGAKLDKDLQERLDEWAEELLAGDGWDDAVDYAEGDK